MMNTGWGETWSGEGAGATTGRTRASTSQVPALRYPSARRWPRVTLLTRLTQEMQPVEAWFV